MQVRVFGLKVFYDLFLKVWSTSSSGFIVDVWSAISLAYCRKKNLKNKRGMVFKSFWTVGIEEWRSTDQVLLLARTHPLICARTLRRIGKRHQLILFRKKNKKQRRLLNPPTISVIRQDLKGVRSITHYSRRCRQPTGCVQACCFCPLNEGSG